MTDEKIPTEPEQLTDEQREAYIASVEEFERNERQVALQAQADLAEGTRQVRERQQAHIKAIRRAFKGIHSRNQIIALATVGLLRSKALADAEIARQTEEASA